MNNLFYSLVFYLWCLYQGLVQGITVRKFVYQKDMSEHCRRRVVPSVFLGNHVVEAHSQILHFSRMELPYSCFISIRAESGSNIVLVVQLLSEESLESACSVSPTQLLVYEMGETFGGYWGPLPDSVLGEKKQLPSKSYTRKTTQAIVHTTSRMTLKNTKPALSMSRPATVEEKDFVRVEMPLLNISGIWVDNKDGQKPEPFDPDETFDLLYDVTPRLKLPRYKVRTTMRRYLPRTNFYVNKLLNYENTAPSHQMIKESLDHKKNYNTKDTTLLHKTIPSIKTHLSYNLAKQNWKEVKKIIKKINDSATNTEMSQNANKNISSILETISNMKHSNSVYLTTDWPLMFEQEKYINYLNVTQRFKTFTRTPLILVNYASKNIHQFRKTTANPSLLIKDVKTLSTTIKERISTNSVVSISTRDYNNTVTNTNTERTVSSHVLQNVSEHSTKNLEPTTITENYTTYKIFTQHVKLEIASSQEPVIPLAGSTVGHESWENVVQAAPVMAVHLNKTVNTTNKIKSSGYITTSSTVTNKKKRRKKRKIQLIPIENARPQHLTMKYMTTTTAHSYNMADIHDLAEWVEINDDNFHERVALRYLRQYVGSTLFNLCANGEPKARHIYLFNSSRIVIAINNFTLERMTVILTPARSLVSSTTSCSVANIECQVYGTRICIDHMNACDGVPNCGAYDIYDEDRLMCGEAGGFQHNVYLAAFTFLALLLTVMYSVHYWIKRCVPKVSEAFFIYTDGAENILYLESIMRSPHDMDGGSMGRNIYRGNLPSDAFLNPNVKKAHNTFIHRIIRACFNCCKCKKNKSAQFDIEDESPMNFDEPGYFSFTELELGKMLYDKSDVAVQTGESLEMSQINLVSSKEDTFSVQGLPLCHTTVSLSDATLSEDFQNHVNELNMLKFCKDGELEPVPSTSRGISSGKPEVQIGGLEEKEIRTLTYNRKLLKQEKPAKYTEHEEITAHDIHDKVPEPSKKQAVKHLRFDEETIAISYDDDNEDEDILQTSTPASAVRHDTEKAEESNIGPSRDFKRFWKVKKGKKKANVSPY